MKLRNKKTGAIYRIEDIDLGNNADGIWLGMTKYSSLTELNEEWEDYEEPKEYYFIRDDGSGVGYSPIGNSTVAKRREAIGNYFGTIEEAEKAVENLKAWKRLKNARLDFSKYQYELKEDDALISYRIEIKGDGFAYEDFTDDLNLFFGGEEWNI